MNRHVVALIHDVYASLNITEVKFGAETLSVKIQSKIDKVDVARSFAITEDTTFDAVSASHDS